MLNNLASNVHVPCIWSTFQENYYFKQNNITIYKNPIFCTLRQSDSKLRTKIVLLNKKIVIN